MVQKINRSLRLQMYSLTGGGGGWNIVEQGEWKRGGVWKVEEVKDEE